jgi:hypothetical protein
MKNMDIMFCPSDSADRSSPSAIVSYWWKYAIDKAWSGQTNGLTSNYQKEGDMGFNADQIVFYERAAFHFGYQQGLKNGVKINCSFLDSHCRSVSLTNQTAQVDTGSGGAAAATHEGEPAYFNFDNNNAKSATNPPPAGTTVTFFDPTIYSDMLP